LTAGAGRRGHVLAALGVVRSEQRTGAGDLRIRQKLQNFNYGIAFLKKVGYFRKRLLTGIVVSRTMMFQKVYFWNIFLCHPYKAERNVRRQPAIRLRSR
jgi:hypothetical protein